MPIDSHKVFEIKKIDFAGNLKDKKPFNDSPKATKYEGLKLVLIPKEGCLPVKFGMTREEIVKILGKPDQFLGKHCLDYSSTLGISLLVHSEKGLLALDCWSQEEKSDEGILCGSTFVGKFPDGVTIGSTREEVEKAFGKNPANGNSLYISLCYPAISTTFTLKDGKVAHISMDKPK
jgi:hypothetical protein